jgi:hypothetical protein
MKSLSGENEAVVIINGFSDNVKDTEIIIENKKVGAGMKISGDRPLVREILWSIRTVLAIEPYISIDIQPGNEFTWKNLIEYYTFLGKGSITNGQIIPISVTKRELSLNVNFL